MESLTDGLRVYRLATEEIETMLTNQYGRRIEPVNKVALARLRQTQRQQEAWKLAFQANFKEK